MRRSPAARCRPAAYPRAAGGKHTGPDVGSAAAAPGSVPAALTRCCWLGYYGEEVSWLRFPRLLGILACLYLSLMAVLFGYLTAETSEFVHSADSTQGTVIRLTTRAAAGSDRPPPPRDRNQPQAPEVRYVVAGAAHTYIAAHGQYRQRLRVGDTVTILYDPSDPARARLRGEGQVLLPLITGSFVATALVVAVMLVRTRHGWRGRTRTNDRWGVGVAD